MMNFKPANTSCNRTRREFLWQAGAGFTGVALAGLLDRDGFFGGKALGAPAAAPTAESAAKATASDPVGPLHPPSPAATAR